MQLIDELLFDFTIDTYKPSAMNTSTLCLEALHLIKDVQNNRVDANNLRHVFEELTTNLRNDEIAKSLYPLSPDTIENALIDESKVLQAKATDLEVLYYHIRLDIYKSRAEELLLDATQDGKEKDRIRALTRAYITTLISLGYSTRYLKDITISFFHRGDDIESTGDIKRFFQKVTGQDQSYRAIFRVSEIFSQIEKPCEAFELKIEEELEPELQKIAVKMDFVLRDPGRFAVIGPFKAKDVFSARAEAQRQLEMVSTLTSVFYHKEVPNWDDRALMLNLDTGKARVVNLNVNPMLMCEDNRPKTAAKRLNNFIEDFSLTGNQDFQRFFRITELHALALKSDSPENQLLNLWVALESLTPSSSSERSAKVNRIINAVIPILNLDYVANLIVRLVRDFRNWNRATFDKYIQDIPGNNEREKLLNLILIDDYREIKRSFYTDIGNFELLRNRAAYFERILKSTSSIQRMLDNHTKRVSWQIRRIYRTRNLIVHTGNTPPYVDILIKNLHDYLDIVISTIVFQASDGEKINSIDQVFSFAHLKYQEYRNLLKSTDVNIDQENIQHLLFTVKIRA